MRASSMLDVLIDGRRETSVGIDERALNYADGLFETVCRRRGRVPMWPWHQARLQHGAGVLGLRLPPPASLRAQVDAVAAEVPDCIIKLLAWAPAGTRGYGRAWPTDARVAVLAWSLPPPTHGLRVVTAVQASGLAMSPRGLKSLARLDEVRAARAALAAGVDTVLLRDRQGRPLAFGYGNLWLVERGRLLTPPLAHGALAGVARAWLLTQRSLPARVEPLSVARLRAADEILLSNAVRGVQAVTSLDGRCLPSGEVGAMLAADWQNLDFDGG